MKKLTALLLAVLLLFSLAACGETPVEPAPKGGDEPTAKTAADSDYAYVREKGTLTVGITDYTPMDYKDEEGGWIGFDADMAKSFADNLGVGVAFVEIKWENKEKLLANKTVDCIWNGLTLTDSVAEAMECSKTYCRNAQTVVVPNGAAAACQKIEDCKEFRFAAEAGSTGEAELQKLGYTVITVQSQSDALKRVNKGAVDAAVIDSVMAAAMVGEGKKYTNLTCTLELSSEELCVGFRKGSDLADELNIFFAAAYADGFMPKVAERYGLQASLIQQIA